MIKRGDGEWIAVELKLGSQELIRCYAVLVAAWWEGGHLHQVAANPDDIGGVQHDSEVGSSTRSINSASAATGSAVGCLSRPGWPHASTASRPESVGNPREALPERRVVQVQVTGFHAHAVHL